MTESRPSQPGDVLEPCEIRISQALIDTYAQISGDFNPIHVNPAAGLAAGFGSTIAHGCLPLEPVLQSLQRWGRRHSLPPGTRIQLRYRAPARPGDIIRSNVTVKEHAGASVTLAFDCTNQHGQAVLEGECLWPGAAQ